MRVIRATLLAAALVSVPVPAAAQSAREVFVVTTEDISFPAAPRHPVIGGVVGAGGIGLVAGDRFVDPARLDPGQVTHELESALRASTAAEVMVIVAGSVEDRPDWLALAIGPPDELLEATGSPGGLTSETTGHDGIVAAVDVTPTALDFLGESVPEDMPGAVIEVEGQPPVDLYERALDYRRVALPVGLAVLALGIGSLVVGV
ncbi:MAG TPA: hypothetical protein VJP08_06195, partial [Actinomycetota bacterium]|nr:hypothetical protein [Actinomycetota bacterium]